MTFDENEDSKFNYRRTPARRQETEACQTQKCYGAVAISMARRTSPQRGSLPASAGAARRAGRARSSAVKNIAEECELS